MSPRKRGRPRKTVAKPLTPLTQLQGQRYAAMATATPRVTQQSITAALEAQGVRVSRTAVGHVLVDHYDNADVQRVFCELTSTSIETMFPGTAAERRERAAAAVSV